MKILGNKLLYTCQKCGYKFFRPLRIIFPWKQRCPKCGARDLRHELTGKEDTEKTKT
jgi:predicted Zn-ribbon and HTH transcriptional regulator